MVKFHTEALYLWLQCRNGDATKDQYRLKLKRSQCRTLIPGYFINYGWRGRTKVKGHIGRVGSLRMRQAAAGGGRGLTWHNASVLGLLVLCVVSLGLLINSFTPPVNNDPVAHSTGASSSRLRKWAEGTEREGVGEGQTRRERARRGRDAEEEEDLNLVRREKTKRGQRREEEGGVVLVHVRGVVPTEEHKLRRREVGSMIAAASREAADAQNTQKGGLLDWVGWGRTPPPAKLVVLDVGFAMTERQQDEEDWVKQGNVEHHVLNTLKWSLGNSVLSKAQRNAARKEELVTAVWSPALTHVLQHAHDYWTELDNSGYISLFLTGSSQQS